MPNFSNISNGESGLSVRNTLNQVIDYVNTGTTYASGYTYITENTTPSSEELAVVVNNGGDTGQLVVGFNSSQLSLSDGGSELTEVTLDPLQIDIGVTDGTNTSNTIIQPNNITSTSTDGTTTLTNINDVNNGVDWQHTNGTDDTYVAFGISNIQLDNTDGTNTSQIHTNPTTIDLSSTDGTNTTTETITPTGITTTSTGSVYISGGTSVELEYYGSPSITSYLLMNNTNTILHTDDGTNDTTQTLTPNGILTQVTDGVNNQSTFDISDTSSILTIFDNTNTGQFEIGSTYVNLTSNDGFNTSNIDVVNNGNIILTSTDGTETFTGTFQGNGSPTTLTYNNGSNFATSYSQRSVDISLTSVDTGTTKENQIIVDATNGMTLNYTDTNTSNFSRVWLPSDNMITLETYDDTFGDYTSFIELGNNSGFGQMNLLTQDTTGFVRFELDANKNLNGTNWTSTISGYTTTIQFDPDNTGTNSKFRNEEISSGAFSELVMTYDNPSFTCNDGAGNDVNIGLSSGNLVLTSTDGTEQISSQYDNSTKSYTSTITDGGNTFNGGYEIIHDTAMGNNTIVVSNFTSNLTGNTTTRVECSTDLNTDTSQILIKVDDTIQSVGLGITSTSIELLGIPSYDDDASASGLTIGQIYQTTGNGASPLDVAGILMVKQ